MDGVVFSTDKISIKKVYAEKSNKNECTITENECTLTDDHIYNNFGFNTTIQAVKLDKDISEVVVQNEYLNFDKQNSINASENGSALKNSALKNWEMLRMYMGIIPYESNYRIRYLEYSSLRKQDEGLQ